MLVELRNIFYEVSVLLYFHYFNNIIGQVLYIYIFPGIRISFFVYYDQIGMAKVFGRFPKIFYKLLDSSDSFRQF